MPAPRCPCIIPCIMSCIMLQSPFCILSTWARTCFRNSANFEGSLGVKVSRAPLSIGSYFMVPGNICPCIIDSLGRSTACMVAICSARRRNSATFSGFVVVMDSATPVAVSVATTDVPSRFIGQAIIMPRPCMGMPGFGCGVLFCSPPANIAAGIRNRTASFLTVTSSRKQIWSCSKHASLHIASQRRSLLAASAHLASKVCSGNSRRFREVGLSVQPLPMTRCPAPQWTRAAK